MDKTRLCVRLDHPTLTIIDLKRNVQESRTAFIERGLRKLHHGLSVGGDRFKADYDLTRRIDNDGDTETIQLRVDRMLVEYFRLNCYNLTTCIKYAVLLL